MSPYYCLRVPSCLTYRPHVPSCLVVSVCPPASLPSCALLPDRLRVPSCLVVALRVPSCRIASVCPPALSSPCALLTYRLRVPPCLIPSVCPPALYRLRPPPCSVLRGVCPPAPAFCLLPYPSRLLLSCALLPYRVRVPSSQAQLRGLCTYSLGVGILPISCPSVYKMYAPCRRCSLMARAFLFFDDQVQSRAQTHVGSKPIVGPFFLDNVFGFVLVSFSDRIYGIFFSPSAPWVAFGCPSGPGIPSHRHRCPSCLPHGYHLHPVLAEYCLYPPLQHFVQSFAPREYVPKLGVRPPLF
jgi:hypothetical protein